MRIINYTTKGQGVGAKFLLIAAVIFAVVVSGYIKYFGDMGIPYAQNIADKVLPIKVVNGELVEPTETKSFNLAKEFTPDADEDFYLVIDPTVDVLDVNNLEPGFYMTKKAIYAISDDETRVYALEGDMEIPADDYTSAFGKIITWTAIITFPFTATFAFLAYFLFVIFYATCGILTCKIVGKKLDFDARMRLSTLAFLTTYVVFIPLGYLGVTSNWLFFFAVLALQTLVLKNIDVTYSQETKRKSINKI